jgi:hypothetical protein
VEVPQHSDGSTRIVSLGLSGEGGGAVETGKPAEIRLRYETMETCQIIWTFSIWAVEPWICVTAALDRAVRAMAPGSGELVGRIPDLPLIAGRYLVHASIMEARTGHAIVRYGDVHSGSIVDVTSPPDAMGNIAMIRNQIVKMDVEWPRG